MENKYLAVESSSMNGRSEKIGQLRQGQITGINAVFPRERSGVALNFLALGRRPFLFLPRCELSSLFLPSNICNGDVDIPAGPVSSTLPPRIPSTESWPRGVPPGWRGHKEVHFDKWDYPNTGKYAEKLSSSTHGWNNGPPAEICVLLPATPAADRDFHLTLLKPLENSV
ncbi:hypothetical protein KM043_017828 [Ampulex compressa]|nr:hypothetical protein KM043_017828 [Ampulex compressa]